MTLLLAASAGLLSVSFFLPLPCSAPVVDCVSLFSGFFSFGLLCCYCFWIVIDEHDGLSSGLD